jgi:hypothetical protein
MLPLSAASGGPGTESVCMWSPTAVHMRAASCLSGGPSAMQRPEMLGVTRVSSVPLLEAGGQPSVAAGAAAGVAAEAGAHDPHQLMPGMVNSGGG